jgi:hypothetical protein
VFAFGQLKPYFRNHVIFFTWSFFLHQHVIIRFEQKEVVQLHFERDNEDMMTML